MQRNLGRNCTSRHPPATLTGLSSSTILALRSSLESRCASAPQAWRPGRRTACVARSSQCRHDRRRDRVPRNGLWVRCCSSHSLHRTRLGQCTGRRPGPVATLPYLMPINPVHLTLLNNGRVLVVAGSATSRARRTFAAPSGILRRARSARARMRGTCSATVRWCCPMGGS